MESHQTTLVCELKELAEKLQTLRESNPKKYYEYKGRINALYENEIDKRVVAN